jgi:hypothetical protein
MNYLYNPTLYKVFAYVVLTLLYPQIILVRLYERVKFGKPCSFSF